MIGSGRAGTVEWEWQSKLADAVNIGFLKRKNKQYGGVVSGKENIGC